MATLGERIRELRTEFGLRQEDFGRQINVVKSAVSHYENNKNTPSDELKKKMCAYFGVNMEYLMGLSNERDKTPPSSDQLLQDDPSEYEELISKAGNFLKNKAIPDCDKERLMMYLNRFYWNEKE